MARKRINLTVESEVWRRCQELAIRFPFVNWSEIAENSFLQILVLFDEVLQIDDESQPKDVESMTERMLLHFQANYHSTLSDAYQTVIDYKNSHPVSQFESQK